MAKKTVKFNKEGINKLPNDKPVVYKILTQSGGNNYTGSAKRGRVKARLGEHLPGGRDYIPGTKVQIEQLNDIGEAREKASRVIKVSKPKHNKKGK